ncbi:hypothetical protein CPC08DRAFT_615692, partial [Agrocybe pediades]
ERLMKDWNAPIYAFFKPTPSIEYINDRRVHVFECVALKCHGKGTNTRLVNRYLDTADKNSTGNLRKHAKLCFGDDTIAAADATKDVTLARGILKKNPGQLKDGHLTEIFQQLGKGKGKVTYSHREHTKTERKAEIVRWVSESMRPLSIVADRGFNCLMKTGRPGNTYIPSPSTVSRDVKQVFKKCRERIAKMLQDHEGALHFATDAWTSPNHRAYVAVTVHFEVKGVPISMLLDLVEV